MEIGIIYVEISRLYTQPEDILDIHHKLSTISPLFLIVAAFDNKSIFLAFHGGSSSTKDEIKAAVQNGVVKIL
ncbi:unnamed protein product [Adineta steineri]|uniref:Uncharacterized protein n=1 Tax=Adineta steineri TaxID=433720 RepID=A0A820K596_9BILA|nr:unnamed protein product [Adineta steineri]